MIKRTSDPGFRIELHQKDQILARENARGLGLALAGATDAQQLCVGQCGKAWDRSTIVRALDAPSGYTVGDAAAAAIDRAGDETPRPGDPRLAGGWVHILATPQMSPEAGVAVARTAGAAP